MRSKKRLLIFILISIIAMLTGCQANKWDVDSKIHSKTKDGILGTVITISMYDKVPDSIYDECFSAVQEIDNKMSVNRQDSEISKINLAGGADVSVSEDTYKLLERAKSFSEYSEGAFDITIGAVVDKWKVGSEFARLPSPDEVATVLPFVGYSKMNLDKENTVRLDSANMRIDLGAIAKGYACDIVADILKKNNVAHSILDFGGNIYAIGTKPDGSAWKVAIRNPILGEEGYVCSVEAVDKTIVTSGGYERYFQQDGKTYQHLLDPKTGYPVENELLSVTIIADNSADADALSTACYVLGTDKAIKFLETMPDFEGIFINNKKEIRITSGLKGKLKIADQAFSLIEE